MFICRRVENDFGVIQPKRFAQFVALAHSAYNKRISARKLRFEFLVQKEHSVLVHVEHNKMTATVPKRLAAKLASYASRAARNHNHFVFNCGIHKLVAHSEFVASQKLFYF